MDEPRKRSYHPTAFICNFTECRSLHRWISEAQTLHAANAKRKDYSRESDKASDRIVTIPCSHTLHDHHGEICRNDEDPERIAQQGLERNSARLVFVGTDRKDQIAEKERFPQSKPANAYAFRGSEHANELRATKDQRANDLDRK
jgi:hypothetical protein